MISEDLKIEDLIKNSAEINRIYTFLYENDYILNKREEKYFFIDKSNSYRIDIRHNFNSKTILCGQVFSSIGIYMNYQISSFAEFVSLFHLKDELLTKEVANIVPYIKNITLELAETRSRCLFEFKNNNVYSTAVSINIYTKVCIAYCIVVFDKTPKLYIAFSPGSNFTKSYFDKISSKKELYKKMVSEMHELDREYLQYPKDNDIIFNLPETCFPAGVYYEYKYYSLEEYDKLQKNNLISKQLC